MLNWRLNTVKAKYRVLIVDDEHLARVLLESYVSKFPEMELVASCRNPVEAMEHVRSGGIDIMFLDIQMPDLTGIEFLQTLRERPVVVFTTAYPDYALEGYSLDVIDYLVKPFSFERFVKAVHKATSQVDLINGQSDKPAAESQAPAEDDVNQFLIVKADHKKYKIAFEDLLYIEGLKAYVSYFTKEKRVVALESLKRLEEVLPADRFIRIHRSYIVPIRKVEAITGNQVEVAGKKLPIGKSYKETVMERFAGV